MRDHTRAIRERTRENRRVVISLEQLFDMIPDEEAAERLFERMRWPHGRCCPRCGSVDTYCIENGQPQPFRCRDCKRYFSLRTDTVLAHSNLPIRKWVIAMYFMSTSIKGVSSAHLARVLRVRHATAWMLSHKIREGFTEFNSGRKLSGTLEVDETYIGGLEKNKHSDKRLRAGRGTVGKAIVVGILDRRTRQVYAEVVPDTRTVTLQRFVRRHAKAGSTLYSDEAPAYDGMPEYFHQTVVHSKGQYVDGDAHTNGIESFWAPIKRGHKGVYHKMSRKHLHRYVAEFTGRNNVRRMSTRRQLRFLTVALEGKSLPWKELTR